MKNIKLDREEKELLKSLEAGEWQSVPNIEQEKKRYQNIARQTLNKIKRVNLRMTEKDFDLAQVQAIEAGIPYQTFLASIVHRYLTGQLVEKDRFC